MKTLLFTLAIGDAAQSQFAVSGDGFRDYAAKYGMDFRCITEANDTKFVSPHYQKTYALDALEQGYECAVYFDVDGILFDGRAPDIRAGMVKRGIHLYNELPLVEAHRQRGDIRKEFAAYCEQHNVEWDGRAYYSSGAFVLFPDGAPVLEIMDMPMGCWEQHAINVNAAKHPALVHELPELWNWHRMQDRDRMNAALQGSVFFAHASGLDAKGADHGIRLLRKLEAARVSQKRNSRIDQPWEVYCPPAPEQHAPRCCMVTVAIGDRYKWLYDITIASQRAYCDAHGITHIVVDEKWRRGNEHPCAMKGRTYDLLKAGLFDRACYIDADIWCNPNAPNIFEEVPPGKLGQYEEGYHWRPDTLGDLFVDFADYCAHYNERMVELGLPTVDASGWDRRYYNAGLFVCELDTCPHLPPAGDVMCLPHRKRLARGGDFYDQHYCNLMRIKHNMPMHELDKRWDTFRTLMKSKPEDCYFIHYAGQEEHKRAILTDRLPTQRNTPMVKTNPFRYHVRFVGATQTPPWILELMQQQILDRAPKDVQTSVAATPLDAPGVINYFNPYRHFRKSRTAIDVAFFTHPEARATWDYAKKECDHAVAMCQQYVAELKEARGVDGATLIYPGVDECFQHKRLRVFNPSKLNYAQNRKGADTWQKLAATEWIEAVASEGSMTQTEVLRHFHWADIIVSTATMEGGPMGVLEGLALGKRVLARKGVGFVDDLQIRAMPLLMRYDDDEDLMNVLREEYEAMPKAYLETFTWDKWAADHWALFDRLAQEHNLVWDGVSEQVSATGAEIKVYYGGNESTGRIVCQHLSSKGYAPKIVASPEGAIDMSQFLSRAQTLIYREVKRQLKELGL